MADDAHAFDRHHLAGLGALDVAAALDGQIDDHGARPHRGQHLPADEPRRRASRNQRRRDDDVLLLDVFGDQSRLLGLVLRRHFLGVAAGGLGLLELFVLDRDEFGAEALHLLLDSRPHVGRA